MNSRQNFIKGTAILIAANAISKILGAIFKIPLTYILQEEGMAIFNTALGVYSTLLTFIISGLPLALSRFIAEEYALKNYTTVKKSVRIGTFILCTLGISGSLILFFLSDFFALAMKDPKAALAIKIISPSVFFVAWGAGYKSYYQGCINMIPTALSQVLEALIKLAAGFAAAHLLRNAAIEISSAGAVSGITISEIVATLILFALYRPSVRHLGEGGTQKKMREIAFSLTSVAVPMLLCSCISGALNLFDVAAIRNSLLRIHFDSESARNFLLQYSSYTTCFDKLNDTLSLSVSGARWLYGAYSGYCLTVFHLPTGIIASLGVCVLSLVSGAIAKNDFQLAQNTVSAALKITVIIALPCALALFMFSDDLLRLLFKNTASAGMLKALSPCLIFVCVSELFIITLHASGHIIEPFLYSALGICVKLLADFFLIPNPYLNIYGAIIGSNAAFFMIMILDIAGVKKYLKIHINIFDTVIKPLVSVTIMGLIAALVIEPMNVIFANRSFALIVTLFISSMAYLLMLVSLDVINKRELRGLRI